jgi:hypothetical protein
VKYGVGDGGSHAHEADLVDAFNADGVESVRLADEEHVHVGDVSVDRHQIVGEGGVGDALGSGVGGGLLQQGPADAADGGAGDLAAGGLGAEDGATVDRRHHPGHPQQAEVGVDVHVGELRGVRARRCQADFLRLGWGTVAVGGELV